MASSRVSFADGFPFLLTSKASLEEVQKATDVDVRGLLLKRPAVPTLTGDTSLGVAPDPHEPVPAQHCGRGLSGLRRGHVRVSAPDARRGLPHMPPSSWRRFKAGDRVIFHGRKRCVRCKIPTTCQVRLRGRIPRAGSASSPDAQHPWAPVGPAGDGRAGGHEGAALHGALGDWGIPITLHQLAGPPLTCCASGPDPSTDSAGGPRHLQQPPPVRQRACSPPTFDAPAA